MNRRGGVRQNSFPQQLLASSEAGLGGGDVGLQGVRGFLVGVALEAAHLENAAIDGVEFADLRVEQHLQLVFYAGLLWALTGVWKLERLDRAIASAYRLQGDDLASALAAEPASTCIEHDGIEPGAELGVSTEAMQGAKGFQDRFLNHILGILSGVGHPLSDAEQLRTALLHDLREAAKSLGVTTTLVSDKSSSIEKGESLKDTGLTLRALGAEAIVLRHTASGAPYLLARTSGLPVLNAGDGMHQHPTQALLDLRTMLSRLGLGVSAQVHARALDGVTVMITGDILHSRVARSNAQMLPRLGARVILCGPVELLPDSAIGLAPGLEIERDFDRALSQAQVAMMLRIQKERLSGVSLNLAEYVDRYQLTEARLAAHASKAVVMHPGPIIRGLELTGEVADCAQSAIEEQVSHGLAVRRAVLTRAMGVRA